MLKSVATGQSLYLPNSQLIVLFFDFVSFDFVAGEMGRRGQVERREEGGEMKERGDEGER